MKLAKSTPLPLHIYGTVEVDAEELTIDVIEECFRNVSALAAQRSRKQPVQPTAVCLHPSTFDKLRRDCEASGICGGLSGVTPGGFNRTQIFGMKVVIDVYSNYNDVVFLTQSNTGTDVNPIRIVQSFSSQNAPTEQPEFKYEEEKAKKRQTAWGKLIKSSNPQED